MDVDREESMYEEVRRSVKRSNLALMKFSHPHHRYCQRGTNAYSSFLQWNAREKQTQIRASGCRTCHQ